MRERKQTTSARRRRGGALVQTLNLIGLLTVLLSLLGITLQTLYRGYAAAVENALQVADLQRLGEDFRRDAHSAAEAHSPAFHTIVFKTRIGEVRYQLAEGVIVRSSLENEQVRRAMYGVPRGSTIDWRVKAEPPEAVLVVNAGARALTPAAVSVRAAVGLDQRWGRREEAP